MEPSKRSSFSGKLGYVLAAAGASVGLGNIWRFPYLAAKYGGGAFLLVYILLAVTFGYTMIIAETAIGRATKKSPVGAFRTFSSSRLFRAGGWINAVIPVLIVPYYSVIGGWVLKYLYAFLTEEPAAVAADNFFGDFISGGFASENWFIVFTALVVIVIVLGVENGIERVSRVMMPLLVVLAIVVAVYAITLPGAVEGLKYFLIPNFRNFSFVTVISAMVQMFYSLSIAMGILITFGSYMNKDVVIESATEQVEIFDTAIAVMAGLMIIPAVFSFSGGDEKALQQGASLMFVVMPKIFAGMHFSRFAGVLFFALVFFAALTSAIALMESAVATIVDELHLSRKKSAFLMAAVILLLGSLSCLGYGPLSGVRIFGMQFLDFFDFITNSVMMPVAAIAICFYVTRAMGIERVEEEVTADGHRFRRRAVFRFMIRYLCPAFAVIILVSSVLNALGIISY